MPINKQLAELVEKNEELQKLVDQDLHGWDPKTLAGMAARKRQAEEDLPKVKEKYLEMLLASSIPVFAKGTFRTELLNEIRAKEGLVIDGAQFYFNLAKKVEITLDPYNPTFGTVQVTRLAQELYNICRKNDLSLPLDPHYQIKDYDKPVKNMQQLVECVKVGVRNSNGDKYLADQFKKDLVDHALLLRVRDQVNAVLIFNVSDEEKSQILKLFGHKPVEMDLELSTLPEEVVAKLTKLEKDFYKSVTNSKLEK